MAKKQSKKKVAKKKPQVDPRPRARKAQQKKPAGIRVRIAHDGVVGMDVSIDGDYLVLSPRRSW